MDQPPAPKKKRRSFAGRKKRDPEELLQEAHDQLELAKQRMISAAIAFCDGSISAGQLRAVRELYREKEQKVSGIEEKESPPFIEDPTPTTPISNPDVVSAGLLNRSAQQIESEPEMMATLDIVNDDLRQLILTLEEKLHRLEEDFQKGVINSAQYRAIRKHYHEQRQVALQMGKLHPENELWRVVLEEGKTTFLMQVNEAQVLGVSFFDKVTHSRLFHDGEVPLEAKKVLSLLKSLGVQGPEKPQGRMFATQTEDGKVLLLIPDQLTAALIVFSQEPPNWQVRALREVHHNFEIANRPTLERGRLGSLIFPDLSRFFRKSD